jgi:hypothetical protein
VTTAGPVGTAPAAIQTPGNVTGATAIEVQRAPDREANRNIVTRPSPTFVKTGYFQKITKQIPGIMSKITFKNWFA